MILFVLVPPKKLHFFKTYNLLLGFCCTVWLHDQLRIFLLRARLSSIRAPGLQILNRFHNLKFIEMPRTVAGCIFVALHLSLGRMAGLVFYLIPGLTLYIMSYLMSYLMSNLMYYLMSNLMSYLMSDLLSDLMAGL